LGVFQKSNRLWLSSRQQKVQALTYPKDAEIIEGYERILKKFFAPIGETIKEEEH
jgi:hypothetical protein